METLLLLTIFVSFFVTFLIIPFWIKKSKEEGYSGKDMHKLGKREVAEGGGVCVLAGAVIGILLYIAINTFYFNGGGGGKLVSIFAILSVLILASLVGIIDDLLGWKKGLSKKMRLLFMLLAAVPLMAINAGVSAMAGIEFGLFYPLILIPLGVVGATTTFNFLAGYNGLEASQGILVLSGLAIVTYITGTAWLSVVTLCLVASLIAFYIFNKYPSYI